VMLDDTRRGWKTKTRNWCREIIAAAEDGELVTGDDAEFLLWLLDRHPRAAEKIGCGVAGFTVQDAQMGTRCFVVHRVDGSSTDFSFYSCITAPDGTVLVRRAMRRAISDQTSEFKRASAARGPLVCAVTGQVLSWDNAHVDHAPPVFVALADDWAARVGGYSAIRLTPAADSQLGRTIADGAAAEAWAEFHRTNAQLRIVSRLANLSLLRKRS
jgi:Protein of unknown function (DUF3223)